MQRGRILGARSGSTTSLRGFIEKPGAQKLFWGAALHSRSPPTSLLLVLLNHRSMQTCQWVCFARSPVITQKVTLLMLFLPTTSTTRWPTPWKCEMANRCSFPQPFVMSQSPLTLCWCLPQLGDKTLSQVVISLPPSLRPPRFCFLFPLWTEGFNFFSFFLSFFFFWESTTQNHSTGILDEITDPRTDKMGQ